MTSKLLFSARHPYRALFLIITRQLEQEFFPTPHATPTTVRLSSLSAGPPAVAVSAGESCHSFDWKLDRPLAQITNS